MEDRPRTARLPPASLDAKRIAALYLHASERFGLLGVEIEAETLWFMLGARAALDSAEQNAVGQAGESRAYSSQTEIPPRPRDEEPGRIFNVPARVKRISPGDVLWPQ